MADTTETIDANSEQGSNSKLGVEGFLMGEASTSVVEGLRTAVIEGVALGGAQDLVHSRERKPHHDSIINHNPLSRQKWFDSIEPKDGRLVHPGRVISTIQRGGIHANIRAEVWPFLLGRYKLDSTQEERKAADFVDGAVFEELRRQCGVLRGYVTKKLKGSNLADEASCVRAKHEALVLGPTMEQRAMRDGARLPPKMEKTDDINLLTGADSATILQEELLRTPTVDSFLARGPKALDDFRDWLRIIHLDAIRLDADWLSYSKVGANVIKEEADRRAKEVELQNHNHLEVNMKYHAARLIAILEAYALYDPETGYCQGMSDLLSPFIVLMESDSQAFWCFVQFMMTAKRNFRVDETGIQTQMRLVSKIFAVCDAQVHKHLVRIQAGDCFFLYRMVIVFFRRELTFEQTLTLWEIIWADWAALRTEVSVEFRGGSHCNLTTVSASKDFLLFIIVAAVLQRRRHIVEKCRGVDDILAECNAMAGKMDIWKVVDDARQLLQRFQHSVAQEKTG